MKFVNFKGRFFSDTHFMNEMFEKGNFREENVKKIVISPKWRISRNTFLCKEFSLQKFLCLLSKIII